MTGTARMKCWLLGLIPWMGTLALANPNGPRPAQVWFGYVGRLDVKAWRVGDECFVPVAALSSLGWTFSASGTYVDVSVGGQTTRVGFRPGSAERLVPLRQAVSQLGGVAQWRGEAAALDVAAVISSIRIDDKGVSFAATLPVKVHAFTLVQPSRVVLDVEGAQLGPQTILELPAEARAAQYKPNVVRIVLETALKPSEVPDVPTCAFVLALGTHDQTPAKPPDTTPPAQPSLQTPASAGPLECVNDTETLASLRLPLSGRLSAPARFRRIDASTLEIALPGATYTAPPAGSPPIPGLSTFESRREGETTFLTLGLIRPMAMQLASLPAEVQIALYKPPVGDGKLAGKTVVVDPGHGGRATGAKSLGGEALEKDINLAIGKLLADRLLREGANVILTRKTDVDIPLKERSEIANRNGADLFISCHVNSNQLANSRSGTITFHHGGNPISNVLAECIQTEIAKVSGLPNLGVWSDTRIYTTGFAVLRYARMPAVLLELGFINHRGDLHRITTPDFQHKVAEAVVRGLKVYLGDAKAQETQKP